MNLFKLVGKRVSVKEDVSLLQFFPGLQAAGQTVFLEVNLKSDREGVSVLNSEVLSSKHNGSVSAKGSKSFFFSVNVYGMRVSFQNLQSGEER